MRREQRRRGVLRRPGTTSGLALLLAAAMATGGALAEADTGDEVGTAPHTEDAASLTTAVTAEPPEPEAVVDEADESPAPAVESDATDDAIVIVSTPVAESAEAEAAETDVAAPAADEPTAVEAQASSEPAAASNAARVQPAAAASGDVRPLVDIYDVEVDHDTISVWSMAREGMGAVGWDLPPNTPVTILLNDDETGQLETDEFGWLEFEFAFDAAPGVFTLTLQTDAGSGSDQFTVVADDEFYDEDYRSQFEPGISLSRDVVSVSQLAEEPVTVSGWGFPDSYSFGPITVDVLFDGTRIETVDSDISGDFETLIAGPLAVGEYIVTATNPVGTASATLHVIPDEQGDAPHAGDYVGSTIQTHAGSTELDSREERPLSFSIDADGSVSALTGEYWWYCYGGHGSGFGELAESEFPATALTVDQPFEIHWSTISTDYIFSGIVRSDGTADGRLTASIGVCGATLMTWSAQLDGEVPSPVYDPEAAVTPAKLTQSELADNGATITGTGFAPESTVTLLVNGAEAATAVADADGAVEFAYSAALDAGVHTLVLRSADGEAAATLTVIPDPVTEPVTIPEQAPSADDLEPALEGAISAPATASAGDSVAISIDGPGAGTDVGVWLFSAPVSLGVHATDDAGTVTVTLPADAATGHHRLAVWSAPDTLIGWTAIEIVADAGDGDDLGDDDGTGDDDGNGNGTGGDGATGDEPGSDGGSADGTGTGGAADVDNDAGGSERLPRTGAVLTGALVAVALLLAALGIALYARRRTTG